MNPEKDDRRGQDDCLVLIYAKDQQQLGKRFVLQQSGMTCGRGQDNHIVFEGDSVSRKHCHFDRVPNGWAIVDDHSTNGTYVNDVLLETPKVLESGDRIKVGPMIMKYLSGNDVETLYHEEIYQITIIDGLTQIHNKRHLQESIEKEVTRAHRYGRELACMMIDVDHFKKVNDTHGHLAGDYVLKELAALVKVRLRPEEVFARYGGEEFCILAPETGAEGARTLAEAVRKKIADAKFVFQGERIICTISIGVALLSELEQRDGNSLLKLADERLFQAKRAGRNRVVS
jgi:diguanylate cyclase (GGDEF)-like protein